MTKKTIEYITEQQVYASDEFIETCIKWFLIVLLITFGISQLIHNRFVEKPQKTQIT